MTTREEVLVFVVSRLPQSYSMSTEPQQAQAWRLAEIGMGPTEITNLVFEANVHFSVLVDFAAVKIARTVADLVDLIFDATRPRVGTSQENIVASARRPETDDTEVSADYTIW